MEKKMFVFTSILAGFLSLVLFSSFNDLEQVVSDTTVVDPKPGQYISAFDLDKSFSFAGEPLPADNFDAIERLDRELVINAYLHSATLLHIKLANRYFPVIEPILKQYGIPDDFKYLAVAESSLRMATSSAGAKGVWQFLETPGEAYGLEINSEVDERYHVEKATEAACKFILHLKNKFGSWTNAAAGYNVGETILKKRFTEQKATSYYDLNLNDETSRYVFRIMAIKEILESPEQYGCYLKEEQAYAPFTDYKSLSITGPIPNLAELAISEGTTYRMLKVYNPWLIGSTLTNKAGKKYEIRLPRK